MLRESDGLAYGFSSDGKLSYLEDTNGNRITAQYTGDQLTRLTHSGGQFLVIAYHASGRIASVTDPQGRATTYGYDAIGEHLLSVTTYDGRVTAYTYTSDSWGNFDPDRPANGFTGHELYTISYPDGMVRHFKYAADGSTPSGRWAEGGFCEPGPATTLKGWKGRRRSLRPEIACRDPRARPAGAHNSHRFVRNSVL